MPSGLYCVLYCVLCTVRSTTLHLLSLGTLATWIWIILHCQRLCTHQAESLDSTHKVPAERITFPFIARSSNWEQLNWMMNDWVEDLAFAGLIGSAKALLCVCLCTVWWTRGGHSKSKCPHRRGASKLFIFLLHLKTSKTHQLKKKIAGGSGIPHTGQLVGSEPISRLPTILDLS